MAKKTNSKVDLEKIKEVKLMIQTLRNFMGDEDDNPVESGAENEVHKSNSSKVTSLPAGPVGTIKIEKSEIDLLNKNWLSQIEKSPFPRVALRPLHQKLLEKYDKSKNKSPITMNSDSMEEIEEAKLRKNKTNVKNKYLLPKNKKSSIDVDPVTVKIAISNEIKENVKNESIDPSKGFDSSFIESKEGDREDRIQQENTSKYQAQNTECVDMTFSSVLAENDEVKPMDATDVGQEIPVTAEILSTKIYASKKKNCRSRKKKKTPTKKTKKSTLMLFDSPADVLKHKVAEEESQGSAVTSEEVPIFVEVGLSNENFEEKKSCKNRTNKTNSQKKNKKAPPIPFTSPADLFQIKLEEEEEPLDSAITGQEAPIYGEVSNEIFEVKQKSSKSGTKKKTSSKKGKHATPILFNSPADLLQVKIEEQEEFEPVSIKPEDILGKCEISFVEIPSLPIIRLQPLSHKVIEEVKKGLYLVNDCKDNESVTSLEDPYGVNPEKKRKARDFDVYDGEQVSSEKTGECNKKLKKRSSAPVWPPRVIEVSFTVYKCSLCPYKSKRLDHMKNHLVKHSNAKLYKCSQCDYESNKEHIMQWHMLRHPGNKAIEMLVPDYKIISEIHDASDVGPHSIIESFVKVFKCSFCRYSCDDASLVESHLSSHPKINCTEMMVCTKDNKDIADKNDSSNVDVQITPPPPPPPSPPPPPPVNITLPDDIKLTPIVEVPKPEDKPEEEEVRISPLEELFMAKLYEICEPKDAVYKLYKCPKCSFKTNLRGNLVRHITLHLNEKLHVCLKCDYETNFLVEFYRHNRNCKGKLKSEDSSEGLSDYSEKNVDDVDMKDLKLFHEINLSKLRRDFTSSPEGDQRRTLLINQSSDSSTRKVLRCINCSYESRYKFIFIKHIKLCDGGLESSVSESNEGVVNNLAIDDCFASRLQEPISQEYFNNVVSHTNPPVVNQDNYNAVNSYTYEDFNVSREVPHPVRYSEETSCTMCSFQAETREEYVKHLQSHYKYRSYQCINCDFKTNFTYILTQHMSKCQKREEIPPQEIVTTEDSQRMYECPHCKYKAYSENQLKAHVVLHPTSNVNPSGSMFRCSECNFVTHRKATLNRHMNNHSNVSGTRYLRNSIEQTHPLNCVDNSNRYIVDNRSAYQSPGEPQVDNHFSSYLDTPESIGASDEHETADNLEGHGTYSTHPHILANRHENGFVGIHNM